jgi:two-component system, chemotaxis family, protein-glutamate methylesterase/glutaminase
MTATDNSHNKIRVMIVDDSLFIRQLLEELIKMDPNIIVVGKAKSGEEALNLLSTLKPDVITLDISMPGIGGLESLKAIMKNRPTPVVILSAYSHEGADITIACLEEGAVGFVLKPSGEMSLDIEKVKDELLASIRAAAQVDVQKIKRQAHAYTPAHAPTERQDASHEERRIIVIGASTGGARTIELICAALPAGLPAPILIALHMPALAFTQSLAKRLNEQCALEVKSAEHHETLYNGSIYLAPGGRQTTVEAISKRHSQARLVIKETKQDAISPSIDCAMQSVATWSRERAIGVILTGMGKDGLEGMRQIKQTGGQTISQDEASSLIFGMPKAVIDHGYADQILPAEDISNALVELVSQKQKVTDHHVMTHVTG